ncbi:alanyl-tRNA editing protein [Sporolactobacillus laevolacticus]|uniref:alanyl-tRNA editing protein n=1 Tax=Sporolactobacillus laevolacticus TaxID=33018 RepID=UPI0025B576A7|nr:alanyl-tRNA editing protein [Sporolactobacillus laevolacticus]MDN3956388.1 alanyl-tRNA editing protein [Sporolactobacillus laevolacticus]
MPVKKLFWENPYLTETEAKITSVHDQTITVDQTIAYAFNGGQQSDSGTIGGYEIIEARKDGKEIYYELEPNHSLESGDDVTIKIDWEKRYKLMRLHFAAELVLENVYQNYNHPEKIGANITADKARVDFYWDGNISNIFPELENKINGMIQSNLEIISAFSDEEKQRRYWEIKGFARVPCGGTHIKKTGEVGPILLKRRNLGKDKERIEIYLTD